MGCILATSENLIMGPSDSDSMHKITPSMLLNGVIWRNSYSPEQGPNIEYIYPLMGRIIATSENETTGSSNSESAWETTPGTKSNGVIWWGFKFHQLSPLGQDPYMGMFDCVIAIDLDQIWHKALRIRTLLKNALLMIYNTTYIAEFQNATFCFVSMDILTPVYRHLRKNQGAGQDSEGTNIYPPSIRTRLGTITLFGNTPLYRI